MRAFIDKYGLNSNHIKIIAMLSMFIDHLGYMLFGDMLILRIIGRLSFPLFAYSIAVGCRHTRSMKNYFLRITVLGIICQIFFIIFVGGELVNTLLTFSMGIFLIYTYQKFADKEPWFFVLTLGIFFFICEVLPHINGSFYYKIDYGFWGVILPMVFYIPRKKYIQVLCSIPVLLIMCFVFQDYQVWCFLSLLVIAVCNEKKGKLRLKYLFYVFYPVHFVIIYIIGLILKA